MSQNQLSSIAISFTRMTYQLKLLVFVLIMVTPLQGSWNCKENGIHYKPGEQIPTNDPCEYCECVGNGEKLCYASKGQCWPWYL